MGGFLGTLVAGWIVWRLYRRQQSTPALRLSDGTGYLLKHAPWERAMAYLMLLMAAVVAALGLYVLWRPTASRSASVTAPVLLLCAACFTGLAAWAFQSTRRRIRVDDSGLTLYRGKSPIEIAWASVTKVTTDLTGALLICSSTGSQIAVNKMLVGIPTLVGYMRRHLPEGLYSRVFAYYTPRAHLGPASP